MEKRLHEAQNILRAYLNSNGKRFSVERYRMLEAILAQQGEFTFSELLAYARKHKKVFAASTVYRNFDIYTESGIITGISEKPAVYKVTLPEKTEN